MCLSADGEQLAVAGGLAGRAVCSNPEQLILSSTMLPEELLLLKGFEKKIYSAPTPPRPSDYRLLGEHRRICVILAMAISPSEPRQLAYVTRETVRELPANSDHASPQGIVEFFRDKESRRLREVLYVAPWWGGVPQTVLILREGVPNHRLYAGLNSTSLCWTEDASALIYCDLKSVYRISLSGERSVLYEFEKDRFAASYLSREPGDVVSFIDYFFDHPADGGPPKVFRPPWLVTLTQDGRIVRKVEWAYFPTGSRNRHAGANLAIIGKERWAFLDAFAQDNKVHLCVGSRSTPGIVRTYLLDADPNKAACCYTLFAFSPDENEVWLSQLVDGSNAATDRQPHSASIFRSRLKKVSLRQE
jgi:hypothetical protein